MPGHMHELKCSGCDRIHTDLSTGTSACWDHGQPWEYEQWACSSCGYLASQASAHCCSQPVRTCQRCGGELEIWTGRVWFEERPGDLGPTERFEGPCPGCGTAITLADTTGLIGLWD